MYVYILNYSCYIICFNQHFTQLTILISSYLLSYTLEFARFNLSIHFLSLSTCSFICRLRLKSRFLVFVFFNLIKKESQEISASWVCNTYVTYTSDFCFMLCYSFLYFLLAVLSLCCNRLMIIIVHVCPFFLSFQFLY